MVIVGGAGNDTITGGSSRDILIGGLGADVLSGVGDQDIVIGGRVTFDTNIPGLLSIQREWLDTTNSLRTYQQRIAKLMGESGGANGAFYLSNSPPSGGDTLLDDSSIDRLLGGLDLDWLIGSQADLMPDWETISGITEQKDVP
jgi:Ca2+-binding RTX toxin-like protein